MTASEKASYLKGLIEGMDIDTSKGEGKLFAKIADLLEDLALSVGDLEDESAYLSDLVDEIDEDLGEVERDVYEIDDDDDDDDCDCDCDDDCDCEDCDGECLEFSCPKCDGSICISENDLLDLDEIECPSCGQMLKVEVEDDDDCDCDDECDCGCCEDKQDK